MLVLSSTLYAFESTGFSELLDIGCHKYNNICYVTISGDAAGPDTCKSNSIRWDEKNDANGKSILMLISSAFYADKKVNFNVSNTCFSGQTGFPTMIYLTVKK